MALESNTFVNGEWTTTTLDLSTVLRHYDERDREKATNLMDVPETPKFGLLTQTIIRSPLVRWILHVRLRDNRTYDVAFIGDDFVQIKELRSDGLLWEVVRKEDFGAHIRNAVVVGSVTEYEKDPDTHLVSTQIKSEEEDDTSDQERHPHGPKTPILPPQFLALQLETGHTIFLMLQVDRLGQLHFVSSRYRVSKMMLTLNPGTHLVVDPTSHYMAVACSEGVFAIYELQTRSNLKEQFENGKLLHHIASGAHMYPKEVILRMEFLYPTPGHDYHIILLVLLVHKGRTRMVIYEWEVGDDLNKVRPKSIKGHQLDESRQMPLLLIPLLIKSAFILVYKDSMSVCEGMVSNSPTFTDFNSRVDPPTKFHNGLSPPLWVSWTRPARRKDFLKNQDNIFIAREDGLIKFLHINSDLDVEDNNIGAFDANCGTAFVSLDFKRGGSSHKDGDLLVIGGDSCTGGTYLLEARKTPALTEPVQNWTPAHDFVTTYAAESDDVRIKRERYGTGEIVPKPDRIFACVGRGLKSTITEFSYGLEAKIGVETDYDAPIMQVWALPSKYEDFEGYDECLFLLTMGAGSGLLSLSGDAAEMEELESTRFDLQNRTVTVAIQENFVVQVTERSLRVVGRDFVHRYDVSELPGMLGTGIDNATISNNAILFTAYVGGSVCLQVLDHGSLTTNMYLDENPSVRTLSIISSNVTSLMVGEIAQTEFAIVAEWSESSINLTFQSLAGGDRHVIDLIATFKDLQIRLDAVVSISLIPSLAENFLLLCGTRNGVLITLEIYTETLEIVTKRVDRIGATSVVLTRDEHLERDQNFFISCDSRLYHLQLTLSERAGYPIKTWRGQCHTFHQIWLSDASNPSFQQPSITTFTQLQPIMPPNSRLGESLLLVSGTKLLLADLGFVPKTIPRHIPIKGTPTRLLYSHSLEALVVAVSIRGLSTLQFVDPETGEDLSQPIDQKTKEPVEFVSGLGNQNEKVSHLFEWAYTKDGKTWNFLIASTSEGRLLIISIDQEQSGHGSRCQANGSGLTHSRPRIKYYTRHRFRSSGPVHSVTGFSEGLLWCAGNMLFCDMLDQAEKRFVRVAEYDLPSPATSLGYKNGDIFALTRGHSLEILKLVLNKIGVSRIERTHGDQLTRPALHHTILHQSPEAPLHLVSDKFGSLVGLWPIANTKADTLEAVFEADLPNSILKFRSAKCRPIWDVSWTGAHEETTMNRVKIHQLALGPASQPETLGLSITGSLSHFTVLQLTTWKYLRFVMDLAIRSPEVCEFTYRDSPVPLESVTEPKVRMHVDGDILKRCLVGRQLESLLRVGQKTPEAEKIFEHFCKLLREHHGGDYMKNAEPEFYLEQAYADLGYFLRPVF